LRRYLLGHTVATAFEMGWAEFGNGDLLLGAEAQFCHTWINTLAESK
jgi:hypothetical protein